MEQKDYDKGQEAQYPPQGYSAPPQPAYAPAGPMEHPPPGYPGYPPTEGPTQYQPPPTGGPGVPPTQYQPPPNYGQTIQGAVYTQQMGGVTTVSAVTQVKPNNYMGLAIFVTICCCWPIGIFAIMKASQVSSHFYRGDYAGAEEASKSAKTWSFVSLGCGIASIIFTVVIIIIYYVVIFNTVQY